MRNRRKPFYSDDTDYTTNSPSYYDDLARKQKLIKMLAEKIWEYEKTLDLTLEEITNRLESYIEENNTLMTDRLDEWDLKLEKFPENVELLLQEWLSDGTLDHIINETIFNWKADKTYVDSEIERLEQKDDDITTHVDTEIERIDNKNDFKFKKLQSSELIDIRTMGRHKRTMISFIDDDTRSEVWTTLKPIVEKHNIPYGVAVLPGDVLEENNQYLDVHQVKQLYDEGWDIASHGWNGTLGWDTASRGAMERDAEKTLQALEDWGIHGVNTHVYHQGRKSSLGFNVASKYFRAVFDTIGGINQVPYRSMRLFRNSLGGRNEGMISSITGLDESTTEHAFALIDKVDQEGGWLIFMTHCWYDEFDGDQLEDVINYIKSKGIDIVGFNEALNSSSNPIEIGDSGKGYHNHDIPYFIVSPTGEVDSNNLRFKVLNGEEITIDTQPLEIEENSMIATFVGGGNPGFPKNAGTLLTSTVGTHYGSSGGVNSTSTFQLFISAYSPNAIDNDFYIRRSYRNDNNEIVWNDFKPLNVNLDNTKNNPLTANISEYSYGKTYTEISTNDASGFPENKAGLLVTTRVSRFDGYNYQEYVLHGGSGNSPSGKYIRSATNTGWNAFVKLHE